MRVSGIYLVAGLILTIGIMSYLQSCTHGPDSFDDLPEVCFEGEILPIFLNSCALANCHDGNGENDIILTNYEGILEGVSRGDASDSELYKVLIEVWSDEMMPPGQPLSLQNRTLIRVWIEQGANYTVCPDISGPAGTGTYINPRACFDRDIMPVILSSCAVTGCHDNITAQEDYMFTSYNGVSEIVIPGNPAASKLFKVITLTDPNDVMPPPPHEKLSSAQIDSIYKWISYGASDDYCGEVCDTLSQVTFSGVIWPIVENSCRGCHSGATPSGSTLLENYSDIASVASTGQLIGVLSAASYPVMPPSNSFSVCRIRQFEMWIEDGFLNN